LAAQQTKHNINMPKGHRIDIRRLEKKMDSISSGLARVSNADDFRKLILEWRRPGWTTPAEFLLVSGMVDALAYHTIAIDKLKGALIKGSKAVAPH
jgi:hypothetical protein